jgi:hypothetical protein
MDKTPHSFLTHRLSPAFLAVLILCAVYTYGAILAFPLWDDAWVWLLLREKGPHAIRASFSDRPVNAWLWSLLARSDGFFWGASLLAQAVLWPALGFLTARLWIHLAPQRREWAGLAALLAVAPFVTKVQTITLNIALASLLPTVLAYGGVVLAFSWVRQEVGRARPWLLAVGGILAASGILIQEYALPATFAGALLLFNQWRLDRRDGRRSRAPIAIALLVLAAVLAYALFLASADSGSRGDVRPEHALGLGKPLAWYGSTLLLALWRGLAGGVLRSIAALPASLGAAPLAFLFGLAGAGLLLSGSRRAWADRQGGAAAGWWATLLGALLITLMPVVIMGRVPWDPQEGLTSRYGIPALPLLALLTTLIVARIPWRAARGLLVAVLGFTALTVAWSEAAVEAQERQRIGRLGAGLKERVAAEERNTIVAVPVEARPLGPPRQWELVARLGWDWPTELTRKLWAYRSGGGPPLSYREEARKVMGPRDNCRLPGKLRKNIRLVERRGKVGQVLWVTEDEDGQVVIEPYCQARK